MISSPFIGSRLSNRGSGGISVNNCPVDELADGGDEVIEDHGEGNILSVHYSTHLLGFAYYSTKRNRFFLFEDQTEVAGDLSVIDKVVLQVEPKKILISTRLDSKVKDRLMFAVKQLILPVNGDSTGLGDNRQQSQDGLFGRDSANERERAGFFGGDDGNGSKRARNMDCRESPFSGSRRLSMFEESDAYSDDFDESIDLEGINEFSGIIMTRQASDFLPDEAWAKVFQLQVSDMPTFSDPRQKLMYLSTLLDSSQKITLLALGALIKEIESSNLISDGDGQKIIINGISTVTLQDLIYLDSQSKLALQIFAIENHPSVYKQGNSRKEGLSLFALYNRCSTRIGSRHLKKLFNQPTKNVQELNERLDMVQFFFDTPSIADGIKSCLKGIQDPSSVIEKMRYADCNVNDWAKLLRTAKLTQRVYEYLRNIKNNFSIASYFVDVFDSSRLSDIIDLIDAVIDFRESRATGRFEINRKIDMDLDELKNLFGKLPDIMHQYGMKEFSRYVDRIPSCQIIYATHLGFHLKVPLNPGQMFENNFKIAGLEFRYRVGESGFYKSPMTRELDETFGDILIEITEKQRKLLVQLQLKVLNGISVLDELAHLCAQIDAYIAIAETSRCFKYKRPVFNDNDEIEVEEGRHPLQEIFVNSYVANDSKTGNQPGKIRIITGPNASGKSIHLKQMALIIYMAHIGSFVPAKYANICVMERIMTRVKTIESISTGLSSYVLDLKQAALMTREKTERSVFVIDELGKGTDPVSGISLLSALINYFSQADHVPHVFLATHFLTINEYVKNSCQISFWTPNVTLEGDDVNYSYKLSPGKASSSQASLIIKATGLADLLLKRSEEIEEQLKTGGSIVSRPTVSLQKYAEKLISISDKFDSTNFDSPDFDGLKFLKEIVSPIPPTFQRPFRPPIQTPINSPFTSSTNSPRSSIHSPYSALRTPFKS
ncbi:mutS protein homolog 5-like [Panonychus citri]|uniref:mutS protein homolog 5-like n=1 Tax=Panonychus citri TaxID=50023 RepID=UPI0023072F81|nr:mutS protein homolog 5-like [Panonychus citri]